MSRTLRTIITAVLSPALVLSVAFGVLEWSREKTGWSDSIPSTRAAITVTALFAAVCAALALFTFLSIKRLVMPMENKLNNYERSAAMLSGILNRSSLAILSFERSGRLQYINMTGQSLFGVEPLEAGDANLFDRLTEDSRVRLKQAMEDACSFGSSNLEVEILPASDSSVMRMASLHLAVRGSVVVPDPSAVYFSGLAGDITERVRLEQQYAEAKEREKQNQTARSEFLARVSHEVRTPLHAIVNIASALDLSAVSVHQRIGLERIELLSRHLLRTVNEFLDFTRLEADQIVLEKEPFQLEISILNVMNTLEVLAKDKPIQLELVRDPNLPEWLLGDCYRLEQILINLLGNAVKFTHEGYIRLTAEREDSTSDGSEGEDVDTVRVRFSVRDTGIGMTEEQFARLFRPFRQADASISRQFGGSGLGLVIAKQLVELMGGRLEAESELESGTEFRFNALFGCVDPATVASTLAGSDPALQASDPAAFEFAQCPEPRPPSRPFRGRVLLVDDDELNRSITRRMLENIGAYVVTASWAMEALRQLKRNEPIDLILMDLYLPEVDGVAAVQAIRKQPQWRSTPIVMLTAETDPEEQVRCYEAGVQQIIAKPVETKELRQVLNVWLGKAADGQPSRRPPSASTAEDHLLLPGLDLQQALDRLNGDRALYVQLLDKMAARYGSLVRLLEQLIAEGNRREAIRLLHSLRGASSLLAANGVYEAATRCEDALARQVDGDNAQSPALASDPVLAELLQRLDEQIQIVIDSIAVYKRSTDE